MINHYLDAIKHTINLRNNEHGNIPINKLTSLYLNSHYNKLIDILYIVQLNNATLKQTY